MIAERSAPLGVKATLASAHRAQLEGEAAAFARLDSDMADLFGPRMAVRAWHRSSNGVRRGSPAIKLDCQFRLAAPRGPEG